MKFEEKLYQMFILGTEGGNIKSLLDKGLGGVIFFTHDILEKNQFTQYVMELKNSAKTITPFLSIDQEGGRVERTENIHNGKKYLSARYAYEKGIEFLENQTKDLAQELADFGLNLNFAPCLDVDTNPNNPIIGERAYSNIAENVAKAGLIVQKIHEKNGILTCCKHFPGHGDANSDSHLCLPVIDLEFENYEKNHIEAFKLAIKNGAKMVMAAHLHCECFDEAPIPSSLSKNVLSYLRKNLEFDGIITSDDMVMKGVAGFGAHKACEMGIQAGINLFIYRNCSKDTTDVIQYILQQSKSDKTLRLKIESSFEKINELKTQLNR